MLEAPLVPVVLLGMRILPPVLEPVLPVVPVVVEPLVVPLTVADVLGPPVLVVPEELAVPVIVVLPVGALYVCAIPVPAVNTSAKAIADNKANPFPKRFLM